MADDRILEPDNIQTPPRYTGDRPQVLTSDTARQGPAGRPVLFVLVASLLGAVLVLGLYWIFWVRTII